jgi:hypothetical protein
LPSKPLCATFARCSTRYNTISSWPSLDMPATGPHCLNCLFLLYLRRPPPVA